MTTTPSKGQSRGLDGIWIRADAVTQGDTILAVSYPPALSSTPRVYYPVEAEVLRTYPHPFAPDYVKVSITSQIGINAPRVLTLEADRMVLVDL